jgi:nitrogen fixation NifU-like protein
MRLQFKVENEIIKDVRFKTYGCGSAIASSSKIIDMLKGRSLKQASEVTNKQIAIELDLPPIKLHCSILAEESIAKAIENYRNKND